MPPSNWLVFDRVREFTRTNRIFQQERILQDQSAIDRLTVGGEFLNFSSQSAILEQTNLQINRLERYKDYEQMDQTGEISLALDLYADECQRGGTRIPQLDGTCPTIAELAEKGRDHEFWVYAYDTAENRYVPAKAKAARVTRRKANFVRVNWDGGSLDCTPDHPVLTKRGWVKAVKLTPGDSLIPVNIVRGCIPPAGCGNRVAQSIRKGYEAIQIAGEWIQTHKWVNEFFSGSLPSGYVVHHRDIRRFNNCPDNLRPMLWDDHKKLHELVGRLPEEIEQQRRESVSKAIKAKWQDSEYRRKMIPHCRNRGKQLCESGNAFRGGSNPTNNWETVCELAPALGSKLSQNSLSVAAGIGIATLKRMLRAADITWGQFIDKFGVSGPCRVAVRSGYQERKIRTVRNCAKKMMSAGLNVHDWESNRDLLDQKVPSLATVLTCFGSLEALANEVGYNHTVSSIEILDVVEDAYDITVPGFDCFAAGTVDSWVIVHNCSLIDPEHKHAVIIRADDKKIKEELEEFYYNTLMVDRLIRPAVRYLCKFGDCPFEVVTDKNRSGVSSLRFMNVYNFTRVETRFGDLIGFFYQDDLYPEPLFLHPWACMHLRLTSFENIYHPYGRAMLDGGRKAFKQLRLMEDAALIYRITRAPEKRKYKIPVGLIPPKEVPEYMQAIARMFKRQRFYNPTTGTFDERYSPMVQEDDFFLPQRPDGSGPDIDILPGAENLDQIADIEYFKKKMISPMKIPFARVGIGEGSGEPNEKSLSQSHAEFAKAVKWIQAEVSLGLVKVGIVHLALRGYGVDALKGFEINLAASSAIEDLYRMETWQTRTAVMAELKDIGWFPKEWIVTRFTDLSPDEIEELQEMEDEETGGGGFGGGGGLGGDLGDEELPPSDELEDPDLGDSDLGDEEGGGDESEELPPPEELEGYDYARTRNIITEMKNDERKSKRMSYVQKIHARKNKIVSPTSHLLEMKELDGLSKPKKEDKDTITEEVPQDTWGEIPKNHEVIFEWSVPEDTRSTALDEVATILKGSSPALTEDGSVTDDDLPSINN